MYWRYSSGRPPQTPIASGPLWVWSDWMKTCSASIAPCVRACTSLRMSMIPYGPSFVATNQPCTSMSAIANSWPPPSLIANARTLAPSPSTPVAGRPGVAGGDPKPKPPR